MADEANLIILLLASYGLLGLKVFGKFRLAGLKRLLNILDTLDDP